MEEVYDREGARSEYYDCHSLKGVEGTVEAKGSYVCDGPSTTVFYDSLRVGR